MPWVRMCKIKDILMLYTCGKIFMIYNTTCNFMMCVTLFFDNNWRLAESLYNRAGLFFTFLDIAMWAIGGKTGVGIKMTRAKSQIFRKISWARNCLWPKKHCWINFLKISITNLYLAVKGYSDIANLNCVAIT